MSSTRTQIYLTDEQGQRIDAVAAARGWTMAETIRRLVDEYPDEYLDEFIDVDRAMEATFGAAPDAEAPSRDDWRG